MARRFFDWQLLFVGFCVSNNNFFFVQGDIGEFHRHPEVQRHEEHEEDICQVPSP
jgi:hypothetical protein